jgi:hypothetical protein
MEKMEQMEPMVSQDGMVLRDVHQQRPSLTLP